VGNLLIEWAPWLCHIDHPQDWRAASTLYLNMADFGLISDVGLSDDDRVYSGTSGWWAPEIKDARDNQQLQPGAPVGYPVTGKADTWYLGMTFVAFRWDKLRPLLSLLRSRNPPKALLARGRTVMPCLSL
jgi:hypothetical protein